MPIYLDHAATTPLRREALDAMLPVLTETFGNPSSAHAAAARPARRSTTPTSESPRPRREPREIVFTSGGTEAINLALKGAAWAGKARGHRIVTSSIEHHAVRHTLRYLEKFGFEIVERAGRPLWTRRPRRSRGGDHGPTILVSLMLANNEVGTIQPIAEIAAASGVTEACSSTSTRSRPAPYLARPARARRGPRQPRRATSSRARRASGALRAPGTHILAQQHGGEQERYRRAGTENVAGRRRAGRSRSSSPSPSSRPWRPRLAALRDRLARRSCGRPASELTGHPTERLPGLLSSSSRGVDGADLDASLDLEGIAGVGRLGVHDRLSSRGRTS